MIVEQLTPMEWEKIAEKAHLVCFDEVRDTSLDRIDFALLAVEDSMPMAYMTCKELDSETVYLQYGGAFPSSKGTINSFKSYIKMLLHLKEQGYERAGTYIENTNVAMLKFALKAGWLVTGVRTFKGSVLLELQRDFNYE